MYDVRRGRFAESSAVESGTPRGGGAGLWLLERSFRRSCCVSMSAMVSASALSARGRDVEKEATMVALHPQAVASHKPSSPLLPKHLPPNAIIMIHRRDSRPRPLRGAHPTPTISVRSSPRAVRPGSWQPQAANPNPCLDENSGTSVSRRSRLRSWVLSHSLERCSRRSLIMFPSTERHQWEAVQSLRKRPPHACRVSQCHNAKECHLNPDT